MTVLMTVYNGLPYLPQAIESVLRQTVRDLELLIVDDASTDGSTACIRGYTDPRIRLVGNERNLGQVASLNRGLRLARGRYIARLDQDDVCLPERLERQLAVLERDPRIGVVGSWIYVIDAHGRTSSIVGMKQIANYGAFLGALITHASPIAHPTAVFRREALLAVGGYDERTPLCEDYALWCALALRRIGAVVLTQPLVRMRIHQGQQSQQRLTQQQANARRTHDRLIAALAPDDRALADFLRMEAPDEETRAHLRELEVCLNHIERDRQLEPAESRALRRRLYWWIGHGACLGALRRRRQTLPLYRFAWRGGVGMARYPAMLAYPVCAAFAPLCGSAFQERLASAIVWLGQQKYVLRFWLAGILGRWMRRRRRLHHAS